MPFSLSIQPTGTRCFCTRGSAGAVLFDGGLGVLVIYRSMCTEAAAERCRSRTGAFFSTDLNGEQPLAEMAPSNRHTRNILLNIGAMACAQSVSGAETGQKPELFNPQPSPLTSPRVLRQVKDEVRWSLVETTPLKSRASESRGLTSNEY